jgi:hypothetical protein
MTNIGLYEHHSSTVILNKLSKVITKLNKNSTNKMDNGQARSLIKELKLRSLTPIQRQKFNRLRDRYTWI